MHEAAVSVFGRNGRLETRLLKARTVKALQKKVDKLAATGNLHEVQGRVCQHPAGDDLAPDASVVTRKVGA